MYFLDAKVLVELTEAFRKKSLVIIIDEKN
jgi:hypothetical protein